MLWDEAEAALRAHIETQWAAGAYASLPLVWEDETEPYATSYMLVNIEGTYAEKSIFGSTGKRVSEEGGIVFFHHLSQSNRGKQAAIAPVVALTTMLELQTIAVSIKTDGGNPPTPVDPGDDLLTTQQPEGQFYRCSGSVPFIVIGTR